MALQFGVSFAGGEREYVRVRRWPFTIGRDGRNDLCLTNSEHISRRHVRILKRDARYLLVALGRNPTFLNGEKLTRNEPVDIHPGDRIELPDYVLQVRNARDEQRGGSTVHLQVVSTTTIIVRRVASQIGLGHWTLEAIYDWLDAGRGREVRIRQGHATLCLSTRVSREQLGRWLEQFDQLISGLDPAELKVSVHDGGNRQAAQ